MSFVTRRVAIIGSSALVLLLAGCLSVTIDVTVEEDGRLEQMVTEMELDPFLYDLLVDQAQQEGYDSLEESMLEDVETEAWESIEYDEEETEDAVIITITATGGDPDELDTIDVTVEEDSITFVEEEGFGDDEFTDEELSDEEFQEVLDQIQIEYIVHMPGEITDTNGEIRDDGRSVQWTLADHPNTATFEVTSDRPQASGIPGFGIAASVVALIGALLLIGHRRSG